MTPQRFYRLGVVVVALIVLFFMLTTPSPTTVLLLIAIALSAFLAMLVLSLIIRVLLHQERRRWLRGKRTRSHRRSRPYLPKYLARKQAAHLAPREDTRAACPGDQDLGAAPSLPADAAVQPPAATRQAACPGDQDLGAAPSLPADAAVKPPAAGTFGRRAPAAAPASVPARSPAAPSVDSAIPTLQVRPIVPLRIVQVGNYTARRERRARRRAWVLGLLTLLLAGAALAAGGWLLSGALRAWSGWPVLTIAAGVVIAQLMMALTRQVRTAGDFRRGRLGETRAVRVMQRMLDGDWSLYRNVEVPESRGGDIDLVLVGPGGLWSFEVKTYSFRTRNRRDYWDYWHRRRWRPMSEHPGRQCRAGASRLQAYLAAQGLTGIWVEAVVLWAGSPPLLSVEEPRTPVWTLEILERRLRTMAARPRLAPEQVQRAAAALDRLTLGATPAGC